MSVLVIFGFCRRFCCGYRECLRGGGSSCTAVGYRVRVPGSYPSSDQKNVFSAPASPLSTKWVARVSKDPGKRKGGEESNGKLPHNAVCAKNNQDPPPGSLRLSAALVSTYLHCVGRLDK
ncbi:hypothetical protein PoB_004809600 [Plakobranchus ocellatus]|uniref:Secreted protein n=1 Tax=Plakobranchus ocellatus TaxID=259542 RepID=A0AAV4BMB5_9GAST|nr:hypothetical protein PoB_004809600 [Plakobranchus ocellatus]